MDYSDEPNIKSLLKQYRLKAKKRFGQNFLLDQSILRFIVKSADLSADDTIIEVGPGPGNLTCLLAEKVRKVIAVELDRDLIELLKETTKSFQNIEIVQEDILKYPVQERDYKVIANIPYYLTSPIMQHFLMESKCSPQLMVLMVQEEVAEKICDLKKQSVLSLQVQVFGKPKILKKVPKQCFYPAPKVDSAILQIECFKKPLIGDPDAFFKLVKAGFSSKRKQLANNLSGYFKKPVEEMKEEFKKLNLDPRVRAEDLKISDWGKIMVKIQMTKSK